MRVAIFCHDFGNIGHPFMKHGLENIMSEIEGSEITLVEQHNPLAHFAFNNFTYRFRKIPHNRLILFKKFLASRLGTLLFNLLLPFLPKFDIVITAGGPSLVPNISKNFEQFYLYNTVYKHFTKRAKSAFDLGLGSALPLNSTYTKMDIDVWENLLQSFDLISCRDSVSFDFVQKIHKNVKIIGCPAAHAFKNFKFVKSKTFLVNYMAKGANEVYNKQFDTDFFLEEIKKSIEFMETQGYRIKIIAHSQIEYITAKEIFSNYEVFYTESVQEYTTFVRDVSIGVASRLHCAIPLAGKNIPILLCGHDTRLETFQHYGGDIVDASKFSFEEFFQPFYNKIISNEAFYTNIDLSKNNYLKIFNNEF